MWTNIEGGAIRPLFMVGNFVRVLQHRITVSGFKGEPEWVKGVVTSINKVPYMTEAALEAEGHLYQYSVLRLDSNTDEERDVELDVITVNSYPLACIHLCMNHDKYLALRQYTLTSIRIYIMLN